MKYCVTIVRYGCLFVEAENENEAIDIANHQTTDSVSWSDDWDATDAVEDGTCDNSLYVKEKTFE